MDSTTVVPTNIANNSQAILKEKGAAKLLTPTISTETMEDNNNAHIIENKTGMIQCLRFKNDVILLSIAITNTH